MPEIYEVLNSRAHSWRACYICHCLYMGCANLWHHHCLCVYAGLSCWGFRFRTSSLRQGCTLAILDKNHELAGGASGCINCPNTLATLILDVPLSVHACRAQLWRASIPEQAPLAKDVDWESLGKNYELAGGSIKQAVVRAATQAALRIEVTPQALTCFIMCLHITRPGDLTSCHTADPENSLRNVRKLSFLLMLL